MKSHFISLFNYDCYANKLILDILTKANYPPKPAQLMAHLLAAQQIWLSRCTTLSSTPLDLWPAIDELTDKFAGLIDDNHNAWLIYLNTLTEEDLDRTISYKNTKGTGFESQLINIITHLINHGTHHRAQIGQQLKFAGLESLPNTDYIFYLRQTNH
jgi:uncharacterized damage-inducible protein DinB